MTVIDITERLEKRKYPTLEALFDAQAALIVAKHGEDAAYAANYGWGVGDTWVETKVYLPKGAMILRSEVGKGGVIRHEWLKY